VHWHRAPRRRFSIAATAPDWYKAKKKGDSNKQLNTEVTTPEAIASDMEGMLRSLSA
jgi:hypothetical protein